MKNAMRWVAVVAVGLILGGWSGAVAADPIPTEITVPNMDCASCAKKVGGKVAEVKGVGKVEYRDEGRYLNVTPKAGESRTPPVSAGPSAWISSNRPRRGAVRPRRSS